MFCSGWLDRCIPIILLMRSSLSCRKFCGLPHTLHRKNQLNYPRWDSKTRDRGELNKQIRKQIVTLNKFLTLYCTDILFEGFFFQMTLIQQNFNSLIPLGYRNPIEKCTRILLLLGGKSFISLTDSRLGANIMETYFLNIQLQLLGVFTKSVNNSQSSTPSQLNCPCGILMGW